MPPARSGRLAAWSKLFLALLAAFASLRCDAEEVASTEPPESGGEGAPSKLECLLTEKGVVSCNGTLHYSAEHLKVNAEVCEQLDMEPVGTRNWWTFLGSALACVCVAAMAAGLTLGLTSIDEFGLHVLCNRLVEEVEPDAEPAVREEAQRKLVKDQQCARMILPVISGHFFYGKRRRTCGCVPDSINPSNEHYLLVTLLLCNAMANEALPLFLDRLVPSWLAIVLSVSVVLIFGEIIPSAVFTGKNQLPLAAAFSPVVRLVKALLLPIAWPLSLGLDKALGHEVDEHRREDLKALVRTMRSECLEDDEMNMIQGVLELHYKTAEVVAAPLIEAKMLAHDDVIDDACLDRLLHWGHSRLFIYRRNPSAPSKCDDIMGVILVKKLLGINLDNQPTAGSLLHALKTPVVLATGENLLSAFEKFREECCHLAIITDKPEVAKRALRDGVVIPPDARPKLFCSLEDVLEEMLKEEIYDEDDAEQQMMGVPMHSRTSTGSRIPTVPTGSLLAAFKARHLGTPMAGGMRRQPSEVEAAEDDRNSSSASSDEEDCC